MKTHKEMVKRLNWYVGRYIDFDGMYGAQCMDLAVDFVYWSTNGKVRLWGNAIDAIRNDLGKYGKVIKNSKNFVPKVGDIAVWTKYPAHPLYGHIGIVYGDVNINTCTILDQNWFGDSTQGAILRSGENYQGVTHFIRLNFKGEPVKSKQPKKASKPKAKKNSTSFNKRKGRKTRSRAYAKGVIRSTNGKGAALRRYSGGTFRNTFGNDLPNGSVIYIFATHKTGWAKVYSPQNKGWIHLDQVKITDVY